MLLLLLLFIVRSGEPHSRESQVETEKLKSTTSRNTLCTAFNSCRGSIQIIWDEIYLLWTFSAVEISSIGLGSSALERAHVVPHKFVWVSRFHFSLARIFIFIFNIKSRWKNLLFLELESSVTVFLSFSELQIRCSFTLRAREKQLSWLLHVVADRLELNVHKQKSLFDSNEH